VSVIVCGSKKYKNRNFDELVDSFEVIVRSNMLLPDMGYGKRDSTIQVCNNHVYDHYQRKAEVDELYREYKEKTDRKHVKKFYDFFTKSQSKFVHYEHNNSKLMSYIIHSCGIEHNFNPSRGLLKCGLSYVAQCIAGGVKPFMVGFSLQEDDLMQHTYNHHTNLYGGHDHQGEIGLIINLHKKGLVDASFCLIEDKEEISFSNEFEPTPQALEILKC